MAVIGADVELLRAMAAALRQGSEQLSEHFQHSTHAMQSLQNSPWSGQNRQRAEAMWMHIQEQFTPVVETLNHLITQTDRFTDSLEEAGRVFGDGVISIADTDASRGIRFTSDMHILGGVAPIVGANLSKLRLGRLIDVIEDAHETIQLFRDLTLIKSLEIVNGNKYANQIIIKGSLKAKEAAFLLPATTHMKGGLINALQKQTPNIIKDVGKGIPFSILIGSAENVLDNWEDYKDDEQAWQKTAVATVLDTAVETTCEAIGSAVCGVALGAGLGAISGGTLAPLGVAVGARIGGVAGGFVGEIIAEKIIESESYQTWREDVVQKGADLIDDTIEQGEKLLDEGKKLLNEGKKFLDDGAQFMQDQVKHFDSQIRGFLKGIGV
ncbi:WXG100 family type VII secretion target [Chloroflexus sp.]|uniref:WXG100 family type VII secretion target n=1 Tax=Chloroflexus sp. TaxID=1904827 RepID=UPI002612094A|nr:WXG100 family type VII secretion target [uncultured Chloroflexus sp.]